MNEPALNSPGPEDLAGQVGALRRQNSLLLLALIVVSGTLTTYLFYQSRTLGKELDALEPQARVVVQNYNQNLPRIRQFIQQLDAYAQRHPDFKPLLQKYGIPLTNSPAAGAAPKAGK
ncbi:MAG: hypothetical protein KGJ60_03860 [Verrucomicrobiota bacterium]|nr:hypothetical protein [Verrucomicrobiota bacterium]